MGAKDLHKDAFDERTIFKLEMFEDYAETWLPTFIMSSAPTICIFDFFAGPGYDIDGVPGSPIRILQKIKQVVGHVFQRRVKIKVFFNTWETKKTQPKFKKLQQACNEFLSTNHEVNRLIESGFLELNLSNEETETIFPKLLPQIKSYPSLVYLDQNGIKFLSTENLRVLESSGKTDFLYFLSSAHIWRHGGSDEFQKYMPWDMELVKKNPYKHVHRAALAQIRANLASGTKLKLYPFTIKKPSGIYGIVFGTSHLLAVDKFLSISWKRNNTNGEANFDIDGDIPSPQFELFNDRRPTKLDGFKSSVKERVRNGSIRNNKDAILYVYDEGHIPSHAAEALKEMKQAGEITYNSTSPCITYDKVFSDKRIIEFNLLRK